MMHTVLATLDPDAAATLAPTIAQFGVAGLIGWMWLTERRLAVGREQQVSELHRRVLEDHAKIEVLLAALRDNTKALTALESAQRELSGSLERFSPTARQGFQVP